MKSVNKRTAPYKSTFLLVLLAVAMMNSACTDKNNPSIQFDNLHVILPPPVSSGTAAYGTIKNNSSEADTLKSIKSNAGMVMLHQTEINNGSAKMIHVEDFKITKDKPLILKPMSYHLMLMNINHKIIKENGSVEFSFEFEKAGLMKVTVPVVSNQ